MFKKIISTADGNEIVDMSPEEKEEFIALQSTAFVPQSITPLQARHALRAVMVGDKRLLDVVNTELAKPGNEDDREDWEYASVIERDSPLIKTYGALLGLSEAQIDNLFIEGAKL